MTAKRIKNVAASVRVRLLNLSRARHDDFQRMLTQYALERWLYRLSRSPHAGLFTLKGALLFLIWMDEPHRRSKDLDLLGAGDPSPVLMTQLFREICAIRSEDDGLVFDAESINAKLIREDNIYGGVRVRATAYLENIRIPIQVDIGFGDAITPAPQRITFPTLLDFPAPTLYAYSQETVIAEKLSAVVALGLDNSRMKDYYDLWVLGSQFPFDGKTLRDAIAATFERRSLAVPEHAPVGLTPEFAKDTTKQAQWRAFVRQSGSTNARLTSLAEVCGFLADFLLPVLADAREGGDDLYTWPAGGPWTKRPTE